VRNTPNIFTPIYINRLKEGSPFLEPHLLTYGTGVSDMKQDKQGFSFIELIIIVVIVVAVIREIVI
jgi:hypothetical protein